MKKFVANFTLISLVFLSLIGYRFFSLNNKIYNGDYFKKSNKPTMLVVGNSHPECAIIDSLVPNIYNVAHSG